MCNKQTKGGTSGINFVNNAGDGEANGVSHAPGLGFSRVTLLLMPGMSCASAGHDSFPLN